MSGKHHDISIKCRSSYLAEQSEPELNRYVFSYTIDITNTSTHAAQLLTRNWVIRQANGKIENITGEGVVGKKPLLHPGERFQYTSGAVIETAVGTMQGSYGLVGEDGDKFDVEIPAFTLSIPRVLH